MLMTWNNSWNVLVIRACDATIAAKVDTINAGQIQPGGTELKNGFE